jgi:hypothetical protein
LTHTYSFLREPAENRRGPEFVLRKTEKGFPAIYMVLSTGFALIRRGKTWEKHDNIYYSIKIFLLHESRMNLTGAPKGTRNVERVVVSKQHGAPLNTALRRSMPIGA